MPAPSMQPVNFFAGANPDLYQRQLALQQQQALAQQLMEQGAEPMSPSQPTNPGGFVPRLSPFAAAAHSGKMLAGAMMQRNINKQQADLAGQQMQAMIQMLQPKAAQPPPAAPGTLGPLASPGISDAAAGAVGAPWAAQSQLPQPTNMSAPAPQAPQAQQGGVDLSQLMQIYAAGQIGGPAGGAFASKMLEPTDLTKNIQAAGYTPQQAQAAYGHTLNPPINVRPGGTVYQPGVGPQFTAPQGGVNTMWQGGTPLSAPVQGAQEAAARGAGMTAGATAEAKTPFETIEIETKDGRKIRVPTSWITRAPSPQTALPGPQPQPVPKPAIAPPGQGITPGEKEAQTANERQLAEEAMKGREAANIAVDTNYNLQHVLQSAQGFDTGKFAPTYIGAKAYLQGLAPNLFPASEMDKLKDFQELQKYSIRLGFDQARKMGARESTQIVQMSIDSNPNPQMVRPAIEAIGHGLMAQNDYVIAKEKARDAWRNSHNGQLSGFNSSWQDMADPRAFLLRYQSPQEQAKLFGTMDAVGKQKLLRGLQNLRSQGIL